MLRPGLKLIIWKTKIMMITLGGFFLSSAMIIFLLPVMIVFGIISNSVYGFLKLKYGKKITRASGLDISQGMETKESRPFINAISRYEGPMSAEDLKNLILTKGINYRDKDGNFPFRRYKQIFEKHYGYFIFRDDDNFDINNHVISIKKEDLFSSKEVIPGNRDEWQVVLERIMKKYGARSIQKDIPQWEMIHCNEGNNRCTVLFRIKHSITDGIYFLRFLLESLGDNQVNYQLPYNYHQPNVLKRIASGIWAFCLLPYGIFRMSFNFEYNPLHGPKLSGEKTYIVSKAFPLEILREIKKKSRVSINTILFSCLSFALRSIYRKKKSRCQNTIVLIPISMQDLKKSIKTKNNFSLQGVLINTAQTEDLERDSALIRLKNVEKNVNKSKRDPSFISINLIIRSIFTIFPSGIVNRLVSTKGLTTSLSNVAGPQEESLYICNSEQTDMAFWVPDRDPLGMGVSVTGYRGRVRLGLMIDKALVFSKKESYEFLNDFIQELHNLRKELNLQKSSQDFKSECGEIEVIKQNEIALI